MKNIQPLSQAGRPTPSLPLADADLSLNNSNWTKGLQAASDWVWSANLNPAAFPNHLGRFFLHIPAIFEQQLNFSTSLIFDEPSFRNGVQVSGFLNRVHKEMVIHLIAQTRHAWYTLTHHAVLGKLTANKHGWDAAAFANKIYYLDAYQSYPEHYSALEKQLLDFAHAFATNPKAYTDEQMAALREALRAYNREQYPAADQWLLKKEAANLARTKAQAEGIGLGDPAYKTILEDYLSKVPEEISDDLNAAKVNAQIVELSFLCLQFVALACVFTGLNIPDESFLPDVMTGLLPAKVIEKINELNEAAGDDLQLQLLPPGIEDYKTLLAAISKGQVTVEAARPKGARIPLTHYEGKDEKGAFRPAFATMPDRDKGLTIGGVQAGVYGWSFGGHFPGSLVYCLMHHPELARFETAYSLPLLFNEDEWRNGVHTGGYVSRKLKELVFQKIYQTNRSRYGLEHHTMFLYNTMMDEYGVGRIANPNFSEAQAKTAREKALQHTEAIVLNTLFHKEAPHGVFTTVEEDVLSWVEALLKAPHGAHKGEARLRQSLRDANRLEVEMGVRVLDTAPGIGEGAAMDRLIDHQIAELVMLTGHMDGLGRVLSILKLEAEEAVQMIEGTATDKGGFRPALDGDGQVQFTGYFNNRLGLHDVLGWIGVSKKARTVLELLVNPQLCATIAGQLKAQPNKKIDVKSGDTNTAEF